ISVWVHAEAIRIELAFRRGSEPHLPVKTRGRGGVRRITDSRLRFVGINPSAGECHFANLAAAHNFAGFLKMLARSLPGAGLHHAVVFARRVDHLNTVVDSDADGLLDVHILT